jgi:hypothetical protein
MTRKKGHWPGSVLTGPLLSQEEAAQIAALYPDDSRFPSTVNMGRHRFGAGEYRYFAGDLTFRSPPASSRRYSTTCRALTEGGQ